MPSSSGSAASTSWSTTRALPCSTSKFALEALSDALRLELAPFGIAVVLVEPGNISSRSQATVEADARAIFANPDSPYRPLYDRTLYARYETVTAGMRRHEPGPDVVSGVGRQAIEASRPTAHYVAGFPVSGRLGGGVLRRLEKRRRRRLQS